MKQVPAIRIAPLNRNPVNGEGDYVLYWMTAFRRTRWNYSLDRAIEWARRLNKSLVVLEALRCDYEWACDRFHLFIINGMADNAARFSDSPVRYYPYVESIRRAGRGLVRELSRRACVVVTDQFPCFFLPRMLSAAGPLIPVLGEQVDANGLLPLRAARQVFKRAYDFRRFIQKNIPDYFGDIPNPDPLADLELPGLKALPPKITRQWPMASPGRLEKSDSNLSGLPIDHSVEAATRRGGEAAAGSTLHQFLENGIGRYKEGARHPDDEAVSGLSPYIHFGHISVHQIFHELMRRESWHPERLIGKATGSRQGWWGVGPDTESFLDQLVTWREIGFNLCWQNSDYDRYESLPDWALETLEKHASDMRPYLYTIKAFEKARTHDPLWNAAQNQLVREGRLHNYLRMLWGKKILEWSKDPREALAIMIELNNKYALDGRDPNSYSGIFWVLGRNDRAWGPERPIFGKVRYMSSANTIRKIRLKKYLEKYGS